MLLIGKGEVNARDIPGVAHEAAQMKPTVWLGMVITTGELQFARVKSLAGHGSQAILYCRCKSVRRVKSALHELSQMAGWRTVNLRAIVKKTSAHFRRRMREVSTPSLAQFTHRVALHARRMHAHMTHTETGLLDELLLFPLTPVLDLVTDSAIGLPGQA